MGTFAGLLAEKYWKEKYASIGSLSTPPNLRRNVLAIAIRSLYPHRWLNLTCFHHFREKDIHYN